MTDPKWDDVAAVYASTKEGRTVIEDKAHEARAAGNHEVASRYRSAALRGERIRDANKDAAHAIFCERLKRMPDAELTSTGEALIRAANERTAKSTKRDEEFHRAALVEAGIEREDSLPNDFRWSAYNNVWDQVDSHVFSLSRAQERGAELTPSQTRLLAKSKKAGKAQEAALKAESKALDYANELDRRNLPHTTLVDPLEGF